MTVKLTASLIALTFLAGGVLLAAPASADDSGYTNSRRAKITIHKSAATTRYDAGYAAGMAAGTSYARGYTDGFAAARAIEPPAEPYVVYNGGGYVPSAYPYETTTTVVTPGYAYAPAYRPAVPVAPVANPGYAYAPAYRPAVPVAPVADPDYAYAPAYRPAVPVAPVAEPGYAYTPAYRPAVPLAEPVTNSFAAAATVPVATTVAPARAVQGDVAVWMRNCTARYRRFAPGDFDPVTGTFLGNDGDRYYCN